MTKYARVADGIVAEIINLSENLKVDEVYHPSIAATIFVCGETISEGWTYSDGTFSAPIDPILPSPTKDELFSYAATRRYTVETGGVTINRSLVLTDRASQSLITGAYNYVQANPEVTVKFKTAGGFVDLTAAQMIAIANAVGAHVQASFAAEAAIIAAIAAGTIKTTADIDTAFWPS